MFSHIITRIQYLSTDSTASPFHPSRSTSNSLMLSLRSHPLNLELPSKACESGSTPYPELQGRGLSKKGRKSRYTEGCIEEL